jgi:hypothetical protein
MTVTVAVAMGLGGNGDGMAAMAVDGRNGKDGPRSQPVVCDHPPGQHDHPLTTIH